VVTILLAWDLTIGWIKKRFEIHVGGPSSAHNQAWRKYQDLMNQKQHIEVAYARISNQAQRDYQTWYTTTIDCIRFLLCQELIFHGRDEYKDSNNQGNFLELLWFLANHNQGIKDVILDKYPGNLKIIVYDIQEDIVCVVAIETTNIILNDLDREFFAILIDKFHNLLVKEEMVIVLHYLMWMDVLLNAFLGIMHVKNTIVLLFKEAIEALFAKHWLSISHMYWQGYDGASNMQSDFNGLKALIMKENPSTYYIHSFAHQLQLVLVSVEKNHAHIAFLFNVVSSLTNVVRASCKRKDNLREKQHSKIVEAFNNGDIQVPFEVYIKKLCFEEPIIHIGTHIMNFW